MKWFTGILLLGCTALFSAGNEKDLKVIIEKSYLGEQSSPFLAMMAQKAIGKSGKQIDPQKLVELFRNEVTKKESLAKFFPSYEKIFSKKEIRKLREIFDNPVWQKYIKEGSSIAISHMGLFDEFFDAVASNYEAPLRKPCAIPQVTKESFGDLTGSGKPLILAVKADWCSPCQVMEPILEDLFEKYSGEIAFGKVDFDTQKELAKEFDIAALPTILFIKPNEKVAFDKNIGCCAKEDLDNKIDKFLKSFSNN